MDAKRRGQDAELPLLLVVYDYGSVPPAAMHRAGADVCRLVFVSSDTAHAQLMRPLLDEIGEVVPIAGRGLPELVPELAALRPSGITTFSEYQIPYTAMLAAALGLPYHSPDDVPAITNKLHQRARLSQLGVDVVRCAAVNALGELDAALAVVGLPAVLKPIVGAGSRNTQLVTTADECRRLVTELLQEGGEVGVILEEPLVGRPTPAPWGDYVAVDCVASAGDVVPIFPTGKFSLCAPFRERGGYGPAPLTGDEGSAVLELAVRAVQALGVHAGVADVEMKLTQDGPRVIEVNGRVGGWVHDLAMRSMGFDVARAAMLAALSADIARPTLQSPRLAFQYVLLAPTWAERVDAVTGSARIRALDRVERFTVDVQPGDSLDWRLGSANQLGTVYGHAASLSELTETVELIDRSDWIVLS